MEVTVTGWALIGIAVFWAILVGFLCVALISAFRVLQTTRDLLEDFRRETTPMLHELGDTVETVNKELTHVDEILGSVRGTASSVEGIARTVQATVAHPAIRALGVAAGAATAYQRFRRKED